MRIPLDQSVAEFHPYAKRLAVPLKRLGITTVRDLLLHTPVRHEDLRIVTAIRDLQVGQRAVVRGRVVTIQNRRSPRRHMLVTEALVSDATGSIRCVWFQQPYLAYAFRQGTSVVIAGTMSADTYGFHLQNPIIERDQSTTLHTGRLVPVYALTSGISQKQVRILAHAVLPHAAALPETLPADIRRAEQLVGITSAVRELHFPSDPDALGHARARFAFEELFTYLQRVRASREELDHTAASQVPIDRAVTQSFIASLPFPLTNAQERAVREVLADMAKGRPMQRLLNGDVGSGKTVVAAIAAASVAHAGLQTAYLAPTEVLALQQAVVFTRWFAPIGIRVALWTRTSQSMDGTPVSARTLAAAVHDGTVGVVIGTHAILTPRVRFHRLGLAIVDEQHRFGVEQRAALRAKTNTRMDTNLRNIRDISVHSRIRASAAVMPHLLSMTATPIPRTLNLSLLGDLDVSLLDELPRGRSPVQTSVIAPSDRLAMTRTIRTEIDAGHQAFVVCPKIDPAPLFRGEKLCGVDAETPSFDGAGGGEVAAVSEAFERAQRAFPGVPVGLLHGRLKRDVQAAIMAEFAAGRVAVLVATSIIEVGVDQPNATIMVVEDAERFGLAQLHQLRGRVGRGAHAGTCFLTTRSEDAEVIERLQRVADCTDGFRLAEIDLEERGPGAMIGTTQSGWPELKYATMDPALLRRVQLAVACSHVSTVNTAGPAHLE